MIRNFLKKRPVYVLLLPLFFVWHGFVYYFDLIPVKDTALLYFFFTGITILFFLLSLLIFRKYNKAAFFSFLLMLYYLFFGYFHDGLKHLSANGFFSKYSFVLPFSLLLFVLIAIKLKRSTSSFIKANFYLNTLFIILLFTDTGIFISKSLNSQKHSITPSLSLLPCDSCERPDIYLIVADGYPGIIELSEIFNYDNSLFEQELRNRGFHVIDSSKSNYNFTPFSVSSMLNMEYLEGLHGSNSDKDDILKCYNTIKNNRTLQYLNNLGYTFYNYSIFDFNKQPSLAKPTFLPRKTRPLISRTLRFRMQNELGHLLVTRFKLKSVIRNLRNLDLKNNTKLFEKTKTIASEQKADPKFIYTHLVMPHYPYYFDSTGKQNPYEILTDEHARNQEAFIQYLVYANRQYLQLIDHILANSDKPPVIILIGDHGFREFGEPVDEKYHFMNLNAVFLPNKNYKNFYNGMSNINQFRVLLNVQFGQNLSLLKDSTSFLSE